jgi:hypothetical protein
MPRKGHSEEKILFALTPGRRGQEGGRHVPGDGRFAADVFTRGSGEGRPIRSPQSVKHLPSTAKSAHFAVGRWPGSCATGERAPKFAQLSDFETRKSNAA